MKYLLILPALVLLYVVIGWLLSKWRVNTDADIIKGDITVYLLSNGVHTDLVVPTCHALMNWPAWLGTDIPSTVDTTLPYLGFGWGDKGFYLETPTWADLKASVAFKAMFWLSTSAMHVTYHAQPETGPRCKVIRLNEQQYRQLIDYIQSGFRDQQPTAIHATTYGTQDAFFEGCGTYNLFFTCNTWTNDGLKSAGLPACKWTGLDGPLLDVYE
ncbi:MAG: TIGR02117 family protein [Flavobacteriales bacterium]|nr:TIGR02117 family protein [Flavobacteriales bacterium]